MYANSPPESDKDDLLEERPVPELLPFRGRGRPASATNQEGRKYVEQELGCSITIGTSNGGGLDKRLSMLLPVTWFCNMMASM